MSAKEDNLAFFKAELPKLLADPLSQGKFAVVHESAIKGKFDTFNAAIEYAVAGLPLDEFVIQQIIDDSAVINFIRAAS